MKYSAVFIAFLSIAISLSCSKKDLPAPNPLNASNTNIPQQNYVGTAALTAPCASSLVDNKISYTYSPVGSQYMLAVPLVTKYSTMIDISCAADHSLYQYDLIEIYLPLQGSFIGKMKYDVQAVSSPSSSVALLSHVYYSINYSSPVYTGYEGTIYAEYNSTQIILSFCGVKVKNGTSIHYVTGKVIIANNF